MIKMYENTINDNVDLNYSWFMDIITISWSHLVPQYMMLGCQLANV